MWRLFPAGLLYDSDRYPLFQIAERPSQLNRGSIPRKPTKRTFASLLKEQCLHQDVSKSMARPRSRRGKNGGDVIYGQNLQRRSLVEAVFS